MRVRIYFALAALALAGASCSSGGPGPDPSPSLDAGPPPHPLEFEFEGLALGAAKETVVDAWGPPSFEGPGTVEYANRGAFANIQLLFKSVPVARNIQPDAVRDAGDDRPYEFLTAIVLTPAEHLAKREMRPQLLSLYGEPLADPGLAEARSCRPPGCEIFRAGECALLRVEWEAAPRGEAGRESAASLTYILAPDVLITEAPRSLWPSLRGAIGPNPPADIGERLGKLRAGDQGAHLEEIIGVLGPPNLVIKGRNGIHSLHYFWLNNAFLKLSLAEGVLRSVALS